MYSTHSHSPTGTPTDPADAICAIGRGININDPGAEENNTHGCACLISPTQIIAAAHVFDVKLQSGDHELPEAGDDAYLARFRRKTNGSLGSIEGGSASYHQVRVKSCRVPFPAQDVVIAELEEAITHIEPISTTDDYWPLGVEDPIVLGGWGLNGGVLDTGTEPGDVLLIDEYPYQKSIVSPLTDNLMYWSEPNPGPNRFDSGSPVIKVVDDEWRIVGVVKYINYGVPLYQFKNDPLFQIPGLYEPADPPPDPPVPPIGSAWITSPDTVLRTPEESADYSETTPLAIANYPSGHGPQVIAKPIFAEFDVSELPIEDSLTGASLVLVVAGATSSTSQSRFRRIRRSGTTDLANWLTYDGSHEWTTEGAEDTDNDVYTKDQFAFEIPSGLSAGHELVIDNPALLDMILDAIEDDGKLRLLWELTEEGYGVGFHSVDAAMVTRRPKLVVTFEDIADPVVVINSPTTSSTYQTTSATVVLSGTATDDFRVASIEIENDQAMSSEPVELIDGTWTKTVSLVGYTANHITVSAMDDTGNIGTDTITVTRIH